MDELTVRDDGPVRHLTIDRPQARNALNAGVLAALEARLAEAAADPAVRVLVLAGGGERAFCAGADLDELRDLSGVAAHERLALGQRVMRTLERLPIPSIAAVRGWALGGGFELALSCSLIVAARSARFGLPEAGLGLMPGYGGTQRLVRAIGRQAALAVMLADERLDAARAWELGLLACAPAEDAQLDARAGELAQQLAAKSPSALALVLEAVDAASPAAATGLRHEAALAALAVNSPDAAEGVAAFLAKRAPAFAARAASGPPAAGPPAGRAAAREARA
ncbi:enoyl-CoA hydratase/isomerase family protein [Conexibacter woesei]|uniref:enoyl-CoA hydratase n=1 Tax=Conexibacter woesei (strain DSM 14684 / CCUG 47730 / CIP 108061 / JCM 11494 / NBRC 100937 / ID131577) TaxID=469383 RepID=D3F6J4_CONWI|nr:enoyl-CoA hydratase-related protein [Conexibacter woesei]ADB50761.1 Enoyl-CoA hydratase/isomerase [Conexibacter woesei DSM 14684]